MIPAFQRQCCFQLILHLGGLCARHQRQRGGPAAVFVEFSETGSLRMGGRFKQLVFVWNMLFQCQIIGFIWIMDLFLSIYLLQSWIYTWSVLPKHCRKGQWRIIRIPFIKMKSLIYPLLQALGRPQYTCIKYQLNLLSWFIVVFCLGMKMTPSMRKGNWRSLREFGVRPMVGNCGSGETTPQERLL